MSELAGKAADGERRRRPRESPKPVLPDELNAAARSGKKPEKKTEKKTRSSTQYAVNDLASPGN